MFGLLAAIPIGFNSLVLAQLTITPGPGGGPIAPGPPVNGYIPGGVGLGGTPLAPGEAARDAPVYRYTPGGVPVLVVPEPRAGKKDSIVKRYPGCGRGGPCLPQTLALTIDSRTADAGKSSFAGCADQFAARAVRRFARVLGAPGARTSAGRHADDGALRLSAKRGNHGPALRDLYEAGNQGRGETDLSARDRRGARPLRAAVVFRRV